MFEITPHLCMIIFYSMCEDNMGNITVLRDMISVRYGFKTCAYYTNNEMDYVINDVCLK